MASSLTQRIVAAVVATELACATAFSGAALWHERTTRLHAFDAMLQGRSDSLLGAVQDAEDPADNVEVDPAELKLPSQDVYAVYNQGGALLGGTGQPGNPLTGRQGDGVRTAMFHGQRYRVLEREALRIIDRAENGGVGLRRPVTIVYAAPTAHLWHEVWEAAGFYAAVAFLLVGLTAVLLVALVRALLHPLQELAGAAEAVSAPSLSFVAPPAVLDIRELRPLAEAMSAAMARLAEAFARQHRFIGDATHELKTAVAVVRSSVQVLAMRQRSVEEYQGGLQVILTDNERVEALVSRMLLLAQFEEQPNRPGGTVDLAAAAALTLAQLSPLALARGVRLVHRLQYAEVPLTAEAAQTLVSNLVVNAIQHSAAGTSVTVTLYAAEDVRRRVVLEVGDSGPGIAAGSLPHVFERFYREDTSRSRGTGGVGLGLAICKSLVEAAGGTIELQSVQGQGTTARVAFILP